MMKHLENRPNPVTFPGFVVFFLSLFAIVGTVLIFAFLGSGDFLLLFVGSLFSLTWIPIALILQRWKTQNDVRTKGVPLLTKFVGLEPLSEAMPASLEVKGAGCYVRTEWFDEKTNTLYYFNSNIVIGDPTDILKKLAHIVVYVDPKDVHRNYMDLTFLPAEFHYS